MADFVPALELSGAFYAEVLEPALEAYDHSAALLGWGSDVLGYDTARSTDHGWGPRLQIFVQADLVEAVRRTVDDALPRLFRGWPVTYGWQQTPDSPIVTRNHVDVTTLDAWLQGQLGLDPRAGLTSLDWLTIPQQQLLGVVRGAVYADPRGELAAVRAELAYFPDDVHRWMLGCQWHRLAQEEHLIGRAADAGDELGSRVAAARQVRELMRLGFLLDKAYWPYTKWFGTAFARLPIAASLAPVLEGVLRAERYGEREGWLSRAYELIARRHNGLELTDPIDPTTRPFFERPFQVLFADRFAFPTLETVADPALRELPLVGSVDQFADSTDVLSAAANARKLRGIYG